MRSLQDFAFSLGEENGNGEELTLIDDAPAEKPKTNVIDFGAGAPNNSRSSIQSSAAAYRDMNRQLGSFYETPKEDKEKRNSNVRWKNSQPGSMRKKTVRAAWMNRWLLWKSLTDWRQKYMNGGQPEQLVPITPSAPVQSKGNATPVKSVSDRTVSGLQQPMSNASLSPNTASHAIMDLTRRSAAAYSMGKNTIRACVHNDPTLMDGQTVKLRLLEPLQAGNVIVPKNSLVSGSAKLQGERLEILVSSLEYAGNIIPVELAVYDSDGQKGFLRTLVTGTGSGKRSMANIGAGRMSNSFAQMPGSRSQWILQGA